MHKILNVCGVMLKELPPESEERMSIETRADIPTIFIHPYLPDNEYNIRVATCLAYILAEEELTNHDDAYQFALKLVIPKKALVRLLNKNSAFIAQNFGVTVLDVKARCVVLISDLTKVFVDKGF